MSGLGTSSHLSRVAWQRYALRHCRAAKRWYPRAIVSLFGKWFIERDLGDVAWYVLAKIVYPMGFNVA